MLHKATIKRTHTNSPRIDGWKPPLDGPIHLFRKMPRLASEPTFGTEGVKPNRSQKPITELDTNQMCVSAGPRGKWPKPPSPVSYLLHIFRPPLLRNVRNNVFTKFEITFFFDESL
jgi:hypothetical protein